MIKITDYGVTAQGKNELNKHYMGKKLTYRQRCLANCYDCMGGYTDGKYSCEITDCPIYPVMPYRNKKKMPGDTENGMVGE